MLWICNNWIRIRIQAFGESGSGSWFFNIILKTRYFLSKVQYKILRLPRSTSRLQKKPPALQRELSAIQHVKFTFFLIFVSSFCVSLSGFPITIRIRLEPHRFGSLDPDPHWGKKLDTDPANADPQHRKNECTTLCLMPTKRLTSSQLTFL